MRKTLVMASPPRRSLAREAGPALGDPPEHEALAELGDRAVVLEVCRQRIEARRVVALAVEMVAVTRHAVLVIDTTTRGDVTGHVPLPAQRILEPRQRHRLAAECDLCGWRRVDRAEIGWRGHARPPLAVGEAHDPPRQRP